MGLICKISGAGPVYSALQKLAQPTDVQPVEQAKEGDDPYIYKIVERNIPYLLAKIEKLNKAAQKLNVPPIKVEIVGESTITQDNEGMAFPVKIPVKHVRIEGHAPKLNGWALAARILHTPEGNILKATPDATDLPTDYRKTPPLCEYCKTNRDRRDTFLVKNEQTGEIKQVGRNCLADFLGHEDPAMYARWAENLADLYQEAGALEEESDGGGGGGGGRGARSFTMEQFLLTVAALRRSFGWVSRTTAKMKEESGKGGSSTADMALGFLGNANAQKEIIEDANRIRKPIENKPEDSELVAKSLDWIRRLKEGKDSNEALSDYLWNLAVAASSSVVNDKTAGIVASLLSAYERANNAAPQAGTAGKGYLGEINKPIVVKGKLTMAKPISSYRGASTLFGLQDEQGNVVKWFDNSNNASPIKPGDDAMVSGVVKAHKQYMGKPETELTGARFLDHEEYEKLKAEQAVAADAAAAGKPQEGAAAPQVQFTDGQKIPSIDLTLIDKKYIETQYGSSTIHTFIDDTGRQYKWFASSGDLDIGHKYTLKATVKKAEEVYNGQKSVILTRVEVVGIGGEKAVTQKDVNAKRKEVKKIYDQMMALHEKKNEIEQQIHASNGKNEDIAVVDGTKMENYDAAVAQLQQNIAAAKEATAKGVEFKPELEKISWKLKDRLTTYRRKKTPAEFMQEAEPHYNASTVMMEELRKSGLLEMLKQKRAEYEQAKTNTPYIGDPIRRKLEDEINRIESQIREIQYRHTDSMVQYSDFEEKYKKLQDDMNRAKGEQGQEFVFKGGDWGHKVNELYYRPTTPDEFVRMAEVAIQATMAEKQAIAPLVQELINIEQQMKPLQAQHQVLDDELNDLASSKGRKKKAAIEAWIKLNCKFAQ